LVAVTRAEAAPDDYAIDTAIRLLYDDLVEVEALAITADEAVTSMPPTPAGKHRTRPGCSRSSTRPQAAPAPRWNAARSW
jgi:hypothetical protein